MGNNYDEAYEHNQKVLDNVKTKANIVKLNSIAYPDIDNKNILNTRDNLKHLLDIYGITVRWNIMLQRREINIPGVTNSIDHEESAVLSDIYHLATINRMPNTRLDEHLDSLAWVDSYHPVVENLRSNPWDGVRRLDEFTATVHTKNDANSNKLIKRWMISAIAAAHSTLGFAAQGVLVLQGDQGIGKTTWVKLLDPFNCQAIKSGLSLDPNNKDSIVRATSCWVGELAELDGTFRKADMAPLKAFITNYEDTLRLPYARRNSIIRRRSVYVATVNDDEFLVDETGNRRWWTIEVLKIDTNHKLCMKQVWAEVYNLWANGEQYWLTDKESLIVQSENKKHEKNDPLKERLYSSYDPEASIKRWASSTDVLIELGYTHPSRSDCIRMGNLLREFCSDTKITRGYKMYYVAHPLTRKMY